MNTSESEAVEMLSSVVEMGKKAVTEGKKAIAEVVTQQPEPEEHWSELVANTEKLMIYQKVDKMEAAVGAVMNAVGWGALSGLGETANQYDVVDASNPEERLFKVVETSKACGPCCDGTGTTWYCCCVGRKVCQPYHKLQLHVFRGKKEIMWIDRPFKGPSCCCACSECCLQEISVFEGDKAVGTVKEPCLAGCFSPQLDIATPDKRIGSVHGPCCCIGGMCCDSTFQVKGQNGEDFGTLLRHKPDSVEDLATQVLTDADKYTMSMPKDTDAQVKALMLASLLFSDYLYFEGETLKVDPFNCSCSCKCCDLYCCGCLCPCSCTCDCSGDEDQQG